MNSNSIFDNLINSYNENLSKNSSKFNLELEMSFHLSKNKNIYTNLFNKLSDLSMSKIVVKFIGELNELLAEKQLRVRLTEKAVDELMANCISTLKTTSLLF